MMMMMMMLERVLHVLLLIQASSFTLGPSEILPFGPDCLLLREHRLSSDTPSTCFYTEVFDLVIVARVVKLML